MNGSAEKVYEANGNLPQGNLLFNTYCLADGEYDLRVTISEVEPEKGKSEQGGPEKDGPEKLDPAPVALSESSPDVLECRIEILNGQTDLAQALRQEASLRNSQALLLNGVDSGYFADYPPPLSHRFFPRLRRDKVVLRRLRREDLASFDSQGYLSLPGFLDASIINPARQALSEVNQHETHGFTKGSGMRFANLHESLPALAAVYANAQLYDVVSDLLSYQAYPCQSLTFIHGSNQGPCQDTIHLTPFPRGMMCGIWIALEDVEPGSGELFYFPGSHLLEAILCRSHQIPKVNPIARNYSEFGSVYGQAIAKLLADNPQVQRQQFRAKAGDVLIWHENLIHGDSPRLRMDVTRMSMVIHAFAEGAYLYFDASGTSGRRDWPFRDTPPGRPERVVVSNA